MCSVCVYKNGTLDVIANEQGSRTTPACIAFTEVETLLGEPARGQLVRNAQSVVVDGMRLLGRRFDDESFQAECALWKFPISCGGKDGNSPQVEVSVNGKATTFTPPRLLALLLARLQKDAVASTGEEVKEAVVAAPAYFDDAQRAALKEAAQAGGVRVKMLLSAPLCVALLHGHIGSRGAGSMHGGNAGDPAAAAQRPGQLLVVDVGGSSCEASVVERAQGDGSTPDAADEVSPSVDEYTVRSTVHTRGFGGRAVDAKLRAHVVKEIKRRQRVDLADNARAMGRLLGACESAKISLTGAAQAQINVEADGMDFSANVSRAALEELTAGVATHAAETAAKALAEASLDASEVDAILLAGGGCRMPRVQAALAALCPSASLAFATTSEESVCRGAALAGAMLRPLVCASPTHGNGEVTATLAARKRLPRALGIMAGGGGYTTIATKRSSVPLRRSLRFAPPATGATEQLVVTLCELPDTATTIDVTDSNAPAAPCDEAPRPVARVCVDGSTVPTDAVALVVSVMVDAAGKLSLSCEAESSSSDEGAENGTNTAAKRVELGSVTIG